MNNNISIELEKLIITKPENDHLQDFIQASKNYEELLKEGLVIRRGYNLMTT